MKKTVYKNVMEWENEMKRSEIENIEAWRDICEEIPTLRFKPEWEVKIIPPWAGAVARFLVKHNNRQVSVYLDWYSKLGYEFDSKEGIPTPYYEIYPDAEGEASRFYLDQTDDMMEAIEESLSLAENK